MKISTTGFTASIRQFDNTNQWAPEYDNTSDKLSFIDTTKNEFFVFEEDINDDFILLEQPIKEDLKVPVNS